MGLSLLKHHQIYQAIKEEHEEHGYPITALCKLGKVTRAAYYKWLHREIPANEFENCRIAERMEEIHAENPQYIAENILNREFHAEAPNQKWLTDVTELKEKDSLLIRGTEISPVGTGLWENYSFIYLSD